MKGNNGNKKNGKVKTPRDKSRGFFSVWFRRFFGGRNSDPESHSSPPLMVGLSGVGVKTFFRGLFEKLDKRMEEKAKSKPCCCKPSDKEKNSCCS